jgi:thiol-disulfide isomerase/thioredoxin
MFLTKVFLFALVAAAPHETFMTLTKEFDAAVAVFMKDYRAADEAAQKKLLSDPEREPRHSFTPRFLAAARAHAGRDAAIPFWGWLLENGTIVDRAVGEEAAAHLLKDHIRSAQLAPALKSFRRAEGLRGMELTVKDLTAVVRRSPDASVRAEALFQRAMVFRSHNDARAQEDFRRVLTEAPLTDAAKQAAAMLQSFTPLAVGTPAPDLEAADLSDRPVKLSGLRGRVVLVDFWGLWCGPCVAELPHLRRLHERFAGRGLTIVGVDSDRDAEAVRQYAAKHALTWTNVLDRGTDGAIAKQWRVESWPTTFLLDRAGVIRARDLRGKELDAMIETLLASRGGE